MRLESLVDWLTTGDIVEKVNLNGYRPFSNRRIYPGLLDYKGTRFRLDTSENCPSGTRYIFFPGSSKDIDWQLGWEIRVPHIKFTIDYGYNLIKLDGLLSKGVYHPDAQLYVSSQPIADLYGLDLQMPGKIEEEMRITPAYDFFLRKTVYVLPKSLPITQDTPEEKKQEYPLAGVFYPELSKNDNGETQYRWAQPEVFNYFFNLASEITKYSTKEPSH